MRHELPDLLQDDGGARHLRRGVRLPDLLLPSTAGGSLSLARLPDLTVVFFYPWTGRPGLPNPPHWDDIPGAHGSTPQAEGFRNLERAFEELGARIVGISTQPTTHQHELAERLRLSFPLLSDDGFDLQQALQLPTFATGGVTYLRRLTLEIRDGRIERVYYPVPNPSAHAREVCAALGMAHRQL